VRRVLGVRKLKGIIRDIKKTWIGWAEYVAHMGEKNIYRVLLGKSEAKKSLGRPESRWEINFETYPK
jgi:hypothetical protein